MPRSASDELTSLLRSERWHGETPDEDEEQVSSRKPALRICLTCTQLVEFDEEDSEDPKQWPLRTRYFQVLQVTLIGRMLFPPLSLTSKRADQHGQYYVLSPVPSSRLRLIL